NIIPFVKFLSSDDTEKEVIKNALQEMQKLTSNCVSFIEKSESNKDFVIITKGDGCYSSVGRVGGAQTVSLASGCLRRKGTIFHEMMHALGFWHEHNRPDRDKHIQVVKTNILDNHIMDFDKLNESEVDTLKQPYDLESVMHYSQWTFAKFPNKATFNLIDESIDQSLIGQRTHLSTVDINKIKTLYECGIQTKCSNPKQPENGTILGTDGSTESSVGTWITYTCNTNYTLIGPNKRLCKYNGTWTGFQTECVNKDAGFVDYCSFEEEEKEICDWKQDLTDDFNWIRLNKRTVTEYTGPTNDKTYEGEGESHPGAKKVVLASISGDQGNEWHMLEKYFTVEADKVYNIIVEGVVGNSFLSDIGIDDIIIKQIKQSSEVVHPPSTSTPRKYHEGPSMEVAVNTAYLYMEMSVVRPGGCAKLQSPIVMIEFKGVRGYGFYGEIAINDVTIKSGKCIADLSCDFENDDCSWENDRSADFDWLRLRGPTPTPKTGPDSDHTSSRGNYIESSAPQRQGDRARLVSPVLAIRGEGCLKLWYHMYGGHVAHLRVFLKFPNGHTEYVWKMYGNRGKQWRFARIPIRQNHSFRVSFQD
ncbi:hypothetical protein FSP39_009452, partial [Pinctada imbricata]